TMRTSTASAQPRRRAATPSSMADGLIRTRSAMAGSPLAYTRRRTMPRSRSPHASRPPTAASTRVRLSASMSSGGSANRSTRVRESIRRLIPCLAYPIQDKANEVRMHAHRLAHHDVEPRVDRSRVQGLLADALHEHTGMEEVRDDHEPSGAQPGAPLD